MWFRSISKRNPIEMKLGSLLVVLIVLALVMASGVFVGYSFEHNKLRLSSYHFDIVFVPQKPDTVVMKGKIIHVPVYLKDPDLYQYPASEPPEAFIDTTFYTGDSLSVSYAYTPRNDWKLRFVPAPDKIEVITKVVIQEKVVHKKCSWWKWFVGGIAVGLIGGLIK